MEHHEFQSWMVETALPLWATAGRDPSGFFYERLKMDGTPDREAIRRTRVQFRQIYVFSAAYLLGFRPDGADIALQAFKKAREQAWGADGRPGWVHLVGPDGAVVDAKRDAYDQAFALLALAWLYRTRHDPEIRAAIDETLAFVDAWIAARSGGWWESVAPEGDAEAASALRHQNPHMHALEAMMALYEATGERSFLDRAREVYHLFAARFFDRTANVVIEYFDADWRPAPPRRISASNPAIWPNGCILIREYQRLTGDDRRQPSPIRYSPSTLGAGPGSLGPVPGRRADVSTARCPARRAAGSGRRPSGLKATLWRNTAPSGDQRRCARHALAELGRSALRVSFRR